MSRPNTISVALIVKNEAQNLLACLESVKDWVDDIVILDSGSTDNTEMIARQYTNKFYTNIEWPGFGPQRQLAQEYVTTDFVLWLDADERITPELKKSIEAVLESDHQHNTVYTFPRLSWAFGRYIRHCGWYPGRVVRLYPTNLTKYNDALVHEKVLIEPSMNKVNLTGDAIHFTYNDLNHYLNKSATYAKAWADQRYNNGKSATLSQGVGHALVCFIKMYFIKMGFLDGKQGFLISFLSAHATFTKYADLWVRTNTLAKKEFVSGKESA